MRKVVLGMNVTLDGYVAGPNGELDWMFPNIDSERTNSIIEGLSQIDTFLMGRITYEGMAAHWPTAHPVVLGTGLPLLIEPINLKLLSTRVFHTGAVVLNYQPV